MTKISRSFSHPFLPFIPSLFRLECCVWKVMEAETYAPSLCRSHCLASYAKGIHPWSHVTTAENITGAVAIDHAPLSSAERVIAALLFDFQLHMEV